MSNSHHIRINVNSDWHSFVQCSTACNHFFLSFDFCLPFCHAQRHVLTIKLWGNRTRGFPPWNTIRKTGSETEKQYQNWGRITKYSLLVQKPRAIMQWHVYPNYSIQKNLIFTTLKMFECDDDAARILRNYNGSIFATKIYAHGEFHTSPRVENATNLSTFSDIIYSQVLGVCRNIAKVAGKKKILRDL